MIVVTPRSRFLLCAAVGAAAGTMYALSPMTVIFFATVVALLYWTGHGLAPEERRWVVGVVAIAALLRLLAVAAMFLAADQHKIPFFSMFGDEAQARVKGLWLRNIAWGIPIEPVAFNSAFDPYGDSGFVNVAALLQLIVGAAPYGLQLFNSLIYLTSAVVLHRATRREYGRAPAFAALVFLLFTPSLFIWSVSALKEPMYYLLSALIVVCTIGMIRATSWRTRMLAGAGAILLLWPTATIRSGAFVMPAASLAGGLAAWALVRKPRLFAVAALALLVGVGPILARDTTRQRALHLFRLVVQVHWGSAITPGHGYKLLDESLYNDRTNGPGNLDDEQAARFVIRGLVSFFTMPWPWQARSPSEEAYIPQQMIWYATMILAIVGLAVGLRRHFVFTAVVASNVIAGAILLSLTNGNIGTLVRMRDMVTPMLVLLAGLGACTVGRWATRSTLVAAAPSGLAIPTLTSHRRMSAMQRAWSGSHTRAIVSTSLVWVVFRPVVRALARAVVFLSTGRVSEGHALDYSRLIAVVRRQWLVRAVEYLAPCVRRWWNSSRLHSIVVRLTHGDDRGLEHRVRLAGWVIVTGAAANALLLPFSTSPSPLGQPIAAVAAGVGLVCIWSSQSIARAWQHRRLAHTRA